MRRFQLFVVAAALLSGTFAFLLPADDANAVSGTCYFNTKSGPVGSTGTCGVSGLGAYGTNDIFTGRSSSGKGDAISRSVNTKSEFVSYVLNRFKNGSDHNQIGAAFIIQEMRGSRAWPSSANVSEWQQLMNRSDITVKGNVWDSKVGRTSWYDDDKKNVFYADHPNVGRYVINIYQDGRKIAQIEHACGNLVAGAASIRTFDIKPTTQIRTLNSGYQQKTGYTAQGDRDVVTAAVGDYVEWRYSVRNSGDDTATFKRQRASKIGDSGSIGSVPYNYGPPSSTTSLGSNKTSYYTATGESYAVQRRITTLDEGKTICYTWGVNPRSSTDTSRDFYFGGSRGCVRIPKGNYDLKPDVYPSSSGIAESGGVVEKVSAIVDNDGSVSTGTEWQFSKIIVQPGGTLPGAGDTAQSPKQWYGNDWTLLGSGTGVAFNPSTTEVGVLNNVVIDDLPIGSRLCWALSVKPPVSGQNVWRHSAPKCITIGKKPKVHIQGGDLRVRGKIDTSTSVINVADAGNKIFGSWAEFGVASLGNNRSAASGAGLREGSSTLPQSQWSGLTFANIRPSEAADDEFGNLDDLPNPADVAGYFKGQGNTIANDDISTDGRNGVYQTGAKQLTVRSSQQIDGRTVVIVAPQATVTIASNIRYAPTVPSLDRLAQVVIIAKEIRIADDVEQVDSWLIASDNLNTCASGGQDVNNPRLSADICQKPLVINGPVATADLYLYRTAGAGAADNAGQPSERINLRPDAYLWGYMYGRDNARPSTASLTDMPPRF